MAKYRGREVKLNKPSRGDVKKFKVFVRDKATGNVKKVNFGSKEMSIKKNTKKDMTINENNEKVINFTYG